MHQQHRTADTSRAALEEVRADGGLSRQQSKIVAHFLMHPAPLTRAELAAATFIALQSVCGRVAELLQRGTLTEGDARVCRISGKKAHPVRLPVKQPDLFA